MNKDPFKEYIKQSEPNKRDKGYAWHTAIGLQAVDGLKTSKYLIDTAIKNIEGDISIDEAQELLNTYYEENPKADTEDRTEEADKVAVRIAKILSEKAFSFTPNEYISIHKKLFTGIYGHAGKLRDYNITKKEWVLNGASVLYGSASELQATLDYDFSEEKKFSYKNLSMEEIIHHLAIFVSRLWQIHVFGEGNTRTTAVFFIKYLRTLGFGATNDIFAENAWYFRNALVRANYNDLKNGIHETTEYLELFLRNLLLDEKNELHNRSMHISGMFKEVDIEGAKVDIESEEVDIENAEKPERSNKKKEQPITLLDILQEQKASKYSGGIYHKTQIDLTYNSNHIEGNRLTHDQTRYIFETNTIGVENEVLNVDDVIETANHFRCIDMIIENAKAALTEKFIKELHLILKNGTSDSRKDWFVVGDYKKLPNEVGGMDTALPEEVDDKMKALLTEYNAKEEKTFEDILDFHVKFERIHPFQDGNGRVGRLIMFKECLKYNIVPFIIEDNLKMFYYRGLKEWNNEKGYLTDTCLTAQGKYKAYLDYFRIVY